MNRKEIPANTFKGAAVGLILPHFSELLEAEAGQDKPPVQRGRTELIAAARR